MSRLIESIRLLNGAFSRLELHQARIDNSSREVFGKSPEWRLKYFLMSQDVPTEGLYKCRIVYHEKVQQVEFRPYEPKPIRALKRVEANDIQYDHKWEDRTGLDELFANRSDYDDILIVKNGLITDTLYANIVLERDGKWFTPQSYLLPGTMRQYLLEKGLIESRVISVDNLREYDRFKLVNAMMEWEGPAIDVSNIY